jgi:hypothetical protein
LGVLETEPTLWDYVKAAFHLKVHVPVVGGLPVNYCYLALATGASVAFWPAALFGAAGELAYLHALSSSVRFQQIVRSKMTQRVQRTHDQSVEDVVASLKRHARDYAEFSGECDEIVKIAHDILGSAGADLLNTYDTNLRELKAMYARLVRMLEVVEDHYDPDEAKAIQGQITQVQASVADAKTPDATRQSDQKTLEILQKRLAMHGEIEQHISLIRAEIRQLSEQVKLLSDQVLVSRSPQVFAENVEVASGVIEQHSEWLRSHGDLLDMAGMGAS